MKTPIRGDKLTSKQRTQVLSAFVHRHLDTTSNTDDEWLAKHAFYFIKDGSRLSNNRRFAVPAFFADSPEES